MKTNTEKYCEELYREIDKSAKRWCAFLFLSFSIGLFLWMFPDIIYGLYASICEICGKILVLK
jgi:hypothetical protein